MSQPRRRRRRGRRGGQQSGGGPSKNEAIRESADGTPKSDRSERGRSRRRRGKGRSGRPSSPKSSEDLVRALPKERPETLTAPPDGQTLEAVIGDLQSTWGVPAYPQEYRITIKVAEEREARGDQSNGDGSKDGPRSTSTEQKRERADGGRSDQPRREKAPAAPGMSSGGGREKSSGSRKRRRRRRRGGGGGNPDGSPGAPSNGGNGSS